MSAGVSPPYSHPVLLNESFSTTTVQTFVVVLTLLTTQNQAVIQERLNNINEMLEMTCSQQRVGY